MQLAAACEPAQAEEERGACVDHVRRCARLGGECHLHARLQREVWQWFIRALRSGEGQPMQKLGVYGTSFGIWEPGYVAIFGCIPS